MQVRIKVYFRANLKMLNMNMKQIQAGADDNRRHKLDNGTCKDQGIF